GIAQRETEALGHLLIDLKRELDLTLVIIEHDIPLIMGISDRILAMADGRLIAEGPPDVVRNDPGVIDAYLGGSITAIERSVAAARRRSRPGKWRACPLAVEGSPRDSPDPSGSRASGAAPPGLRSRPPRRSRRGPHFAPVSAGWSRWPGRRRRVSHQR